MPNYKLEIEVKGTDRASGAFRSAGSALQRMGEIAGGILGARLFMRIGQEAMDAARSVVEFGKESLWSAARVEEMNAVLVTLADNAEISRESVMAAVEAVKEEGITTQVAQKAIAQFTRYQLDMAKASDLAKVAQNAAVISMQDSSTALEGLIHGITTMNTRVLRTYGITLTSAVDAQTAFAESVGKTRDELTANEKVNAVLNAVLDQGTAIAGAYDAAMGTAGKKQRSLTRYVTEFKNAIGMPFQNLLAGMVDAKTAWWKTLGKLAQEGQPLNRIMIAMARILQTILGKALSFGEEKGEGLAGVLELVANWIENIADKIEQANIPNFFDMWGRLTTGIMNFINTVKPIFDILSALAKYFGFIITEGDPLNDWITHLPEEWQGPVQKVGEIVAAMRDAVILAWQRIQEWVRTNWPIIKAKILEVWEGIKAWFQTDGQAIFDRILEVFNRIKAWVETNWPLIKATILTAWEVIKANIVSAIEVIRPHVEKLIESFKSLFSPERIEVFKKFIGGVATAIGAILQFLFGVVVGIIGGISEGIATAIQVIYKVIEALTGVIDGVKKILAGDLLGGVMDILHSLANAMWNALIGIGATITNFIAGFVDTFYSFFLDLYNRLIGKSLIPDMLNAIVDEVFGFIPRMLDAGKAFIQGLWDGMKAIWDNVTSWITDTVGEVINIFEEILGISSPSKVMAKIGQQLMAGMAEGMQGSMLAPLQTMGAMAPAMMGAMGGSSSFSKEVVNNYNLTIQSRAQQEDVKASFDMMRALGGGGT